MTAPGRGLERRLGPFDAAAIVISNVIGSGIFFVPLLVAQMLPHPGAILGVWLAGGALAFVGAMAYGELASLRPRAGGEYVYLRDAFGPLAAFLSGWTSFVAGFSGAIAANAVALADYVGRFLPGAADTRSLLSIPLPGLALVVTPRAIVALAVIAALTIIHLRGLGPGRLVQNLLAGLKVSALAVFIALGFTLGHGDAAHLTHGAAVGGAGFLLALVPVMFTYSGWNAAAYVAEEVRNPGRNVPLALGIGTVTVVAIYVALNALYLYAMPAGELASLGGGRLMDAVAERLFGFVAGNLLALFSIVSIAASISAMVLAGPRVYYAMACDGLFFRSAARVHPRYHTPAAAIIAQGVWSGVLVLSGTLSQLVSYTGFAVVLFAAVAVAALFVLRRRAGDAPRPFSAWGYPWAPAIFVLASAVIVVNEMWRNGTTAAAGVVIIAVGIPVYFAIRRRNAIGSPAAPRA
ncbi:MAG TPA: amino acid permease [Vicinamibacterales bacterium]|nr:amino acid permease [Vicinamibacterales bacterium]